ISGRLLMSRTSFGPLFDRLARSFDKRPSSGYVLLWLLRGCFGAICIGIAMLAFRHFSEGPGDSTNGYLAFLCILGACLLIVVTDVLIRNKQITTLSAVYFGLLLGLLLGNILSTALEPFVFDWDATRMPAPAASVHAKGEAASPVPPTPQAQRVPYQRRAVSIFI